MGPAGSTGYSVMLIVSLDRISVEPLTQLQHRAAEPHIRSPLRAADTKIPHTRGPSGSGGWDQSLWGRPNTFVTRGHLDAKLLNSKLNYSVSSAPIPLDLSTDYRP